MRIDTTAESINSIGAHYGVNGANLSRQYKDVFGGFRQWGELDHTQEWILYKHNVDLSPAMMKIARKVFPTAYLTNDRFHVQRLFYEAIDDLRISYRWMENDLENEQMRICRENRTEQGHSKTQSTTTL